MGAEMKLLSCAQAQYDKRTFETVLRAAKIKDHLKDMVVGSNPCDQRSFFSFKIK